jgi:DDE superfamily endonuclease
MCGHSSRNGRVQLSSPVSAITKNAIGGSAARRLRCGSGSGRITGNTEAIACTRTGLGRRFECYRHGTLSLYAALDTQSGKVLGKTAARHTSQVFVEFLTEVVEWAPAREVHILLDNLSAHKSQVRLVQETPSTKPPGKFHPILQRKMMGVSSSVHETPK